MSKIVLFGLGDLAQIALEYFTEAGHEVVGFTVDEEYMRTDNFMGLPVIGFRDIETVFPPSSHEIHVCLVYADMNRCRQRKCAEAKARGYKLASYISPRAFVSPSARIGEHAFIFEGNVVQSYVTLGDNVILWSSNHIGHSSTIGNNVFVSSHVVISGHCAIGENCFLGVNSTIPNATSIGKESWISHGSLITSDVPEHSLFRNGKAVPLNEDLLKRALDRKKP